MAAASDAQAYWNRVAEEKSFTHPLNAGWLARWVQPDARILDYGCGYGRVLRDLASLGFANAIGVDSSALMIDRGRREDPRLDLRVIDGLPVPLAEQSFDLVLLFAVLTCIASDTDQSGLVAELFRLLRPGGLLYLSDMPLQTDTRNEARYDAGFGRFGTYGVFEIDDGAVLRHHADGHFEALLSGFEPVEREAIAIMTMNGNSATAVQILARRPAKPHAPASPP